MGALTGGYGQRQNNNFKKKNQWWLTDTPSVFRILPASDRFTNDPFKWNQYHAVHKGYKNMEGKLRMFESTLQKKNKEVVVRDAAVERFDTLKAAHAKATLEQNGALMKQLNDLIGMRGVYSIDKKWHMNVISLEGAVGTFALNYTAKAALDVEIKRLQDEGVDPLSLDNGRYFVFSKSNTGGKTTFNVRVYQEEVEVNGKKYKQDLVGKNLTDSWANIEKEMVDLSKLYLTITPEEIEEIVKESDLKTGKSPACDRIFDARWKAERAARGNGQQYAPAAVPTAAAASTPTPTASAPVAASIATPAATPTAVASPAPATPTPLSVPTPTAFQKNLDEQSDEEFFAQIDNM
jgi:hypothetical protein